MQKTACYEVVSYSGANCPTRKQLLWLLQSQTKSEHSLACIVLLDREICSRRKSPYISYGAKSLSPSALGKLNLSTQLLAVVHYLSRRYAPATYPESHCRNTTAISHTIGTHALAVLTANFFFNFRHSSSCQLAAGEIKLYKNLTYAPYATCSYHVAMFASVHQLLMQSRDSFLLFTYMYMFTCRSFSYEICLTI